MSLPNKLHGTSVFISLIIILGILPFYAQADELKAFVSDGCSAFPNGPPSHKKLWLSCCQQHDYDYWKGGTYQERLGADRRLKACVAAVGEPKIALLMLAGVRVGGTPYLPTKFRWGYGWPYPRFYGPLNEEELIQVDEKVIPIP